MSAGSPLRTPSGIGGFPSPGPERFAQAPHVATVVAAIGIAGALCTGRRDDAEALERYLGERRVAREAGRQ